MAKRTTRGQSPPPPSAAQGADSRSESSAGKKPAQTFRYGKLKAAIWMNEGQTGTFYNVTFSRSYQGGQSTWHDTSSFNTSDLPTLAKLANDCHSWIAWQERQAKKAAEKS